MKPELKPGIIPISTELENSRPELFARFKFTWLKTYRIIAVPAANQYQDDLMSRELMEEHFTDLMKDYATWPVDVFFRAWDLAVKNFQREGTAFPEFTYPILVRWIREYRTEALQELYPGGIHVERIIPEERQITGPPQSPEGFMEMLNVRKAVDLHWYERTMVLNRRNPMWERLWQRFTDEEFQAVMREAKEMMVNKICGILLVSHEKIDELNPDEIDLKYKNRLGEISAESEFLRYRNELILDKFSVKRPENAV